jgi:hypothetical protein
MDETEHGVRKTKNRMQRFENVSVFHSEDMVKALKLLKAL